MVMIDDGELNLTDYAASLLDQFDDTADAPGDEPISDEPISFVSIALAPPSVSGRLPRAVSTLSAVCVVLGVTAAPVMAILGCVGLTLPATSLLNRVATLLLCAAVIGLGLALVMAHGARGAGDRRRDGQQEIALRRDGR